MRRRSVEEGLRYASRKRGKIKLAASDFGGAPVSGRGKAPRSPLDKRLLGWSEGVVARLHHTGLFANAEILADNDGHRLVLTTDDTVDARLVLSVEKRGLDARVELPDERTFRTHVQRHARELFAALELLPEEFTIGGPREVGRTARDTTLDELTTLLEKPGLVRIGWRVQPDVALAHAELIDEQLEDALVVLAPILKMAESARVRRDIATSSNQGVAHVDTKAVVDRGARVQVLDGPFAGKVGVVKELDGKGGARVMLGLLAAHLDLKDLAVAAARRPVLGSSHRRPIPTNRKTAR